MKREPRVYIRAFEPDDYILINQWRRDDEVSNLYCGNRHFISSEREKKWVEQKIFDDKSSIYVATCMIEDDRMIGYQSIINIDLRNRKAELGGQTIGDKSLWGKGIATEAANLVIDYAFNEYPFHKLQVRCLEEHVVTQKLLATLGFTKEGMFRDEVFRRGSFHSILLYSMLRSEYEAVRANPISD